MKDRLYNFFVLTNQPRHRILHVQIDSVIQRNLTDVFAKQRNAFLNDREEIEYQPGYHPDQNEIFKISPFEDLDDLLEITTSPSSCESLEPNLEMYSNITAFFAFDSNNNELLFQNFDSRGVISTERSLYWSNNTFTQINVPGISLAKNLTAIVRGEELLFQSSWSARRIFDLTQYLKEATDDQIEKFIQHSSFNCSDKSKFFLQLGAAERIKVCLILESGVLDTYTPKQMGLVAADLKYELPLDQNGRIVFQGEKKQIKVLLRFLAEEYMMSPLTDRIHIVTSKRPLLPKSEK